MKSSNLPGTRVENSHAAEYLRRAANNLAASLNLFSDWAVMPCERVTNQGPIKRLLELILYFITRMPLHLLVVVSTIVPIFIIDGALAFERRFGKPTLKQEDTA